MELGAGEATGSKERPPLVCGACHKAILRTDGTPNRAPAHSCKQCKQHLHAWSLCDAVWLPADDLYFCSAKCIRDKNDEDARTHALTGSAADFSPIPIVQSPDCQQNEEGTTSTVGEGMKATVVIDSVDDSDDDDADATAAQAPDSDVQERDPTIERAPPARDAPAATDAPPATTDTEAPAADDRCVSVSESVLDQLLLQGSRLQIAYKQGSDDNAGKWFGCIVGGSSSSTAHIYIGYDDGDLMFHSSEELKELAVQDKLKALSRHGGGGLVADQQTPVSAQAICHIRLNQKILPVGVLLGNGQEIIAGQVLYSGHVLSNEVAAELKNVGYNIAIRRGRSRCIDSADYA